MITEVLPITAGTSDRGEWKRLDFIVQYGTITFPKIALLTIKNAHIDDYAHLLHRGKKVIVSFDIQAIMSKTGKYFNNVVAYRLEEIKAVEIAASYQQQQDEITPFDNAVEQPVL